MLGTNIGIDLGTTTIRIFVEGKGIVVSEPSAVAFDTDTGRLLAVGQESVGYDRPQPRLHNGSKAHAKRSYLGFHRHKGHCSRPAL